MPKFIDLTGEVFGRLTVVSHGGYGKYKETRWNCSCVCGNTKTINARSLVTGRSKSCGCLRKEITAVNRMSHGMTRTRTWNAWNTMIRRCYDSKTERYKSYGGRGITVCDTWREDFNNFLNEMGEAPSDGHSIDRINPDGNYNVDNCRWANALTQARNKRAQKREGNGVYKYKDRERWYALIRVNGKNEYLGYYDSIEKAIAARKEGEKRFWSI